MGQDFFSFEPLLEPMDHSDIALRDRRPRPSPVPDSGADLHVTMKKWDESKQCCYLKVLEFKTSPKKTAESACICLHVL